MDADVIVVGAGLAGLVATAELADAGQAGRPARPGARGVARRAGVLVVRRPVPRRLARAAPDGHPRLARARLAGLARAARASTATEDHWPRRWAEAYVDFAGGEKRAWLRAHGASVLPGRRLGRARRRYGADGHGNSVPRFHITWGTGPGRGRAVRAPGAGGGRARPRHAAVPAPRRRAGHDGGVVDRRPRRGAGAEQRRRAARRARASSIGDVRARARRP